MSTFNKFYVLSEDLSSGVHDFRAISSTLKLMLSNVQPLFTNEIKTDITEIAPGNGYTAGGEDINNDMVQVGGITTVSGEDITWTADPSGSGMAEFQYIVLYNDTPTTPLDPLIGWWDRGTAVNLISGDTHTADFGAAVFTVT